MHLSAPSDPTFLQSSPPQPLFHHPLPSPKNLYSVGVAGRCEPQRESNATPLLSPAYFSTLPFRADLRSLFPLTAAFLTHVSSPFSSLLKRALFPVFCSGTCSLSLRLPLSQIRPTRACFTFHRYLPRFGTKNRTSGQIGRHVAKQLFSAQTKTSGRSRLPPI